MPEPLKVDWSTAEVSDGQLTVSLDAKPPKKWGAIFERTSAFLSAGTWVISLDAKKGLVKVESVSQDDGDRVRQLVEGATLEANAAFVDENELFGTQEPEDDESEIDADADQHEVSADDELTERFRAFANQGSESDSER